MKNRLGTYIDLILLMNWKMEAKDCLIIIQKGSEVIHSGAS